MRVVWIGPWFGNYRIPLFAELNKLLDNNFYVITSKENLRELVRNKLVGILGNHAIIMEGEQRTTFGNEKSDFANSALVIKKQPGLYKQIKKISPDLVVVIGFGNWSPVGLTYAMIHRKKVCMVYERTKYVERNSPWYRTWYRRIIGRSVDTFFINGQLTKEYLNETLWYRKIPKVKGCMVADSHELAKAVAQINDNECQAIKNGIKLNDGLTFLFVGQMVERKGIKELLEAWEEHIKKHKNDNLIVIGSGVNEALLKEKYVAVPSIHIMGGIAYNKIHFFYRICDVFVMPTLEDNWCLVIPEAMACGKPVACSIYNGGHVELVKDGINGYNFDPLKKESICETLAKFHHADLKRMGEESMHIEADYWPEKAAKKMFEAMRLLLDDKDNKKK